MDPIGTNPFALLTFIAAPAILTNASSVMGLGTSNRFARAVDRVRSLSAAIRNDPDPQSAASQLAQRQLHSVQRRALLLVRALSAFYVSVGSFAGASLVSLLGAAFVMLGHGVLRSIALALAFCAGVAGVGGLVVGCGLLVMETRLTLRILSEEIRALTPEAER